MPLWGTSALSLHCWATGFKLELVFCRLCFFLGAVERTALLLLWEMSELPLRREMITSAHTARKYADKILQRVWGCQRQRTMSPSRAGAAVPGQWWKCFRQQQVAMCSKTASLRTVQGLCGWMCYSLGISEFKVIVWIARYPIFKIKCFLNKEEHVTQRRVESLLQFLLLPSIFLNTTETPRYFRISMPEWLYIW